MAEKENSAVDEQRKRPWTVMIFMVAERVPEWADLSSQADETLRQIKSIVTPESQEWLRIRIQLHTTKGVTRYASRPTGLQEITDLILESEPILKSESGEGETDLTNGLALAAFLKWALRTAEHKDDDTVRDNSLLVMWGHAYPFGIGFRDTGTGVDALDFSELATVLNRIQEDVKRKFTYMDPRLDILGFDACDLATIELARHFSPYAKYLVASQMPIPLPGWPYRKILGQLSASRTGVPMTPENLGSYIVRTFCGSYQGKEDPVSLSLLNLQQAKAVFDQTEELAKRLIVALDGDSAETDKVARLFDLSQTYRDKPFVDAADFCENLVRFSNDSSVRLAAGNLGNLLTVPAHANEAWPDQPFILECGRNAHDTVKLHGVSLYAPNVAINSHDWRKASYWYEKFNPDSLTRRWSALVEALSQGS